MEKKKNIVENGNMSHKDNEFEGNAPSSCSAGQDESLTAGSAEEGAGDRIKALEEALAAK